MTAQELTLAAAAGAVCLAICATLLALVGRRRSQGRLERLAAKYEQARVQAEAARAGAEAFDTALIVVEAGRARLTAGEESLAACAKVLGAKNSDPQAVIEAMARVHPDHARRLEALFARGASCDFEVGGLRGGVSVEGRAAGGLAWLRLTAIAPLRAPVWANQAWYAAVGVSSLAEAKSKGLALDLGIEAVVREAAAAGEPRECTRWTALPRGRRALRCRSRRARLPVRPC